MNRHIVIFTHQKDIESHEEDTIHIDRSTENDCSCLSLLQTKMRMGQAAPHVILSSFSFR